jgi:hypothetical protein
MKIPRTVLRVTTLLFLGLAVGCETNPPALFRPLYLPSINVASKMMDDPIFPDKRRKGVNYTVVRHAGKHPPYTQKYAQLAQSDSDYTVRAIAIRALNRSRDASATPIFIQHLSDDQPLVRLEAAKALNRLPDNAAVPLLIQHLQPAYDTGSLDDRGTPIQLEEIQDVRIASAEALSHYKSINVARALIDMLDSRDFGLAWQSHQSLQVITGKDFAYDQAAWLNYLSSHSLGT